MPRHTLSTADEFFVGNAYEPAVPGGPRGVPLTPIVQVDLGTPAAAAANAISLSQGVSAGVAALLNGATGVGGVAVLDVPRNVVAAWTNTAILTIVGLDRYGRRVVETSASGTTFTGRKAFARILSATFNAAVTGATIGTGAVLGLPYRIGGRFDVLAGYVNETLEHASSTVVGGDATTPSGTTLDVRGTYAPATAPNGTNRYRVWMKVFGLRNREESYGTAQFAG